ncbi:hypothetical protein ACF0H5_003298 [Mactra antiquata]
MEVKEVYNSCLKKDGCSGVTQQQAKSALIKLGITPRPFEIEYFWYDIDKESDLNTLNLEEFEKLRCVVNTEPDRSLRWAFNKFDTDSNGTIDKTELKQLLVLMYEDNDGDWVDDDFVTDCLNLADENGDGVLQREEFVDMVLQRT